GGATVLSEEPRIGRGECTQPADLCLCRRDRPAHPAAVARRAARERRAAANPEADTEQELSMSAVPKPAPPRTPGVPSFDLARVRSDFPILELTVNGKPLAYLDNAAS